MKFKPVYFYIFILVAAVAALVLFTGKDDSGDSNVMNKEMPMDDVHKNLNMPGGQQPGKENVTQDYQKQLETLKASYEKNPDDTLKIREYADFLTAAHNHSEALSLYQKIISKNPKRTDIYFSIASIYYTQKDFKKSEDAINNVLKYDSKNFEARYNLGAISASLGDKEKAKLLWEKIVEETPDSPIGQLAESSLDRL
ncbi:MAG: tetratricopeptide repeat protein [Ignavibacteriales bacterium]|nr:MAG: tetratricopeptide repeat protein [Ignavibacteriales bacterium]